MTCMSSNHGNGYALSPHAVRILYQLQCDRASARVDISDACDLSATTVTSVTGSLLEQGLIVEAETAEEARGRGRPRVLLSLEPSALTFIGVKVSVNSIELAIVDFTGKPVATHSRRTLSRRHQPHELVEQLLSALRQALTESNRRLEEIAGIGVGLPGFINKTTGVVHWSPVLDAIDVNLLSMLRAEIDCPINLDNDANLATLAERWYGMGVGEDDFLVVTVEHGVGLGAFVNGALLRGARGVAGEFGHTTIVPNGALCACGKRGCLEAYVADYAVVKEALTLTSEFTLDDSSSLSDKLQALANRARAGEAECQRIFSHAGDMLGIGISNLINVLNPTKIILSGARIQHFDLLQRGIETAIERNVVRPEKGLNQLHVNIWGDQLWTQGGAALALQEWFGKVKSAA